MTFIEAFKTVSAGKELPAGTVIECVGNIQIAVIKALFPDAKWTKA